MGLFKKIFKPVAKVLDKVIPNEIKPALPYLAAFAPVFAPAPKIPPPIPLAYLLKPKAFPNPVAAPPKPGIIGKKVKVYKPRVEVTIKHLKTGREYLSDAEAKEDVDSPVTDTTQDDISRSVNIVVGPGALGGKTNI